MPFYCREPRKYQYCYGNKKVFTIAIPVLCVILQHHSMVRCLSIHICSDKGSIQDPVVQSIVSLTSLLRVILLTVLADSIYNILIFFAEKM